MRPYSPQQGEFVPQPRQLRMIQAHETGQAYCVGDRPVFRREEGVRFERGLHPVQHFGERPNAAGEERRVDPFAKGNRLPPHRNTGLPLVRNAVQGAYHE